MLQASWGMTKKDPAYILREQNTDLDEKKPPPHQGDIMTAQLLKALDGFTNIVYDLVKTGFWTVVGIAVFCSIISTLIVVAILLALA